MLAVVDGHRGALVVDPGAGGDAVASCVTSSACLSASCAFLRSDRPRSRLNAQIAQRATTLAPAAMAISPTNPVPPLWPLGTTTLMRTATATAVASGAKTERTPTLRGTNLISQIQPVERTPRSARTQAPHTHPMRPHHRQKDFSVKKEPYRRGYARANGCTERDQPLPFRHCPDDRRELTHDPGS